MPQTRSLRYRITGIQVTDSVVIPLENGIQILGMDPGFHRGDDCAGMTDLHFA